MNKLTKVGCSALCGSLAAISAAQAGDITVTGGVDMSWISKSNDTTGNPIGIGSNLTFKGSGELDNGWTVDLTIANANASAYSAANVGIGMGGLGTLNINQGNSGNGLCGYDDKMPTAWEEPWGNGLSTGVKLVCGVGSSMNVQYTTPTVLGSKLILAVAPVMGTTDTADKGSGGSGSDGKHKGYDAVININPSLGTEILSGLNVYAGAGFTDIAANSTTADEDTWEAVGGITFDIGPLSIGQGWSGHYNGEEVDADYNYYKQTMFGVAFNINDDLSVSYGEHTSYKAGVQSSNIQGAQDLQKIQVESVQIAYSMGGASIRLAETEGDNLHFSAGNNKEVTVLSVALAF